MTWTDAARNHLESRLLKLRRRLGPDDGDPDEVVADCRRHVEAATAHLPSIDVADIDAALARLGPVGSGPAGRTGTATEPAPPPPHPGRRILWWLLVTILPAAALGFGLHLEMDPLIPTVLHAALIATVPAAGLVGSLAWHRSPRLRTALVGLALGTAAYYALALMPVVPIAMIGILFLGLGLLPLAPLFATVALGLTVARDRSGPWTRRRTLAWSLAAVAALGAFDLHMRGLLDLIEEAKDPASRPRIAQEIAARGSIRYLEPGQRGILGPVLTHSAFDIGRMGDDRRTVDDQVLAELRFRATGELDGGSGRAVWWDELRGRQTVGAPIHDLTVQESRLDGSVDAEAALAYLEWSWVFANQGAAAQEARCELVLPPEAVVSRLTLWVDGEPREAAVGSRAQAVEAYRRVAVRQNRDPALVTTLGGDRVLLQAFPVPARGTLRVRLGITAPMALDAAGTRARLLLPAVAHHNLAALPAEQPAWIAATAGIAAVGGTPVVDWRQPVPMARSLVLEAPRRDADRPAWTPDGTGAVVQTWRPADPKPIVVVLDGGAALAPWAATLRRDLAATLPGARILVAQEGLVPDETPFAGGHDGSAAVAEALAQAGADGRVVWIHGPQPIGQHGHDIGLTLARGGARLVEVATAPGPVTALQATDGQGSVRSLRVDPPDIAAVLARLPGLGAAPVPERRRSASPPPDGHRTSDHLVRLEAADRIRDLLAGMTPDRRTAQALAEQHRLVTPVSGLVVLETRAQEVANGLTPGDGQVPSIPEPETWLLLGVALACLAALAWRRRRTA